MQGACDSPLTEQGIHQAQEAQKILKDVPFKKAYCSTSERTRDTADIILEGRDVPVEYTKGLKEIDFGDYEGLVFDEHKEEILKIRSTDNDWTGVHGENLEMLKKRLVSTYQKIIGESEDGDKILIVSHGAVFMQYFPLLFDIAITDFFGNIRGPQPVPNGYVGTFEYKDGKFYLSSYRSDSELVSKLYHRD